jgi:hypothetical protein
MASGKVDAVDVIVSRGKQYLELIELFGRVGRYMHPVTAVAFRVLDVGMVGGSAMLEWLEKDLEKQVARGDLAGVERAIRRLLGKSGRVALRDINAARGAIDRACRGGGRVSEAQIRKEVGAIGREALARSAEAVKRTKEIETGMLALERRVQEKRVRDEIVALDRARKEALASLQEINERLEKELRRAARMREIAAALNVLAAGLSVAGFLQNAASDLPAEDRAVLGGMTTRDAAQSGLRMLERRARWQSGQLSEELRYRSLRVDGLEAEQWTRLRQLR